MKDEKKTCGNCKAYDECGPDIWGIETVGACHRHPPHPSDSLDLKEDPVAIVSNDWWCLDHVPMDSDDTEK